MLKWRRKRQPGVIPDRWDVDWNHEALQRPLFLIAGGEKIEQVTGTMVTPAFNANERVAHTRYGPGLLTGSNARWEFTPAAATDIVNNRQVSLVCFATATGTPNQAFGGLIYNYTNLHGIHHNSSTDGSLFFARGISTVADTNLNAASGDAVFAYGRIDTLSANSIAGGAHTWPGNSALNSSTNSAGALNWVTTSWCLGGDARGTYTTSRYWPGVIHLALGVQTYLPQDVINAINHDPFVLLKPRAKVFLFKPAAGGGTDIAAGLESLSLSTFGATVSSDRDVSAALESISLAENRAQVGISSDITASLESISLTEFAANVASDTNITASLESITLSPQASTVGITTDIAAALEALTLTENQAAVTVGANIQGVLESISLTPNQAGVTLDVAISAGQESITLTTLQAAVGLGVDIQTALESLQLTENGATVALDVDVSASLEALVMTTLSASITGSGAALTVPGLEYTLSANRLHFTVPVNRIHFTISEE